MYSIGIDYGSDSARAVLVDASTGRILAGSTMNYPRWAGRRWCDPSRNVLRQNALDYLEVLGKILSDVVAACPDPSAIKAIGVDATGSTPCFTDSKGRPLSLYNEFKDDPDAMFILWKDHSAMEEAAEIAAAAGPAGYLSETGGGYSPECTWAKALHVLRTNPAVAKAAEGLIEECDYITNVLTGCDDFSEMKISHCAPVAKQMYKSEWGGFPPKEFLRSIDPLLEKAVSLTPSKNYNSYVKAGVLCPEWAARLGLSQEVTVGVGNIDAHSGAIGAGIEPGKAVLNIGTSACYMALSKREEPIEGVFGQAEGSIVEGWYGLEAGLSAFGDVYAWLKNLLGWGREPDPDLLRKLGDAAAALPLREDAPIATDNFNGRRSPRPSNSLTAGIAGLSLGVEAPEIYRALVESTAFASKAAIDLYLNAGVEIEKMVAIGGITQKSPFVMQTLADVVGRPIEVSDCKDSCALGAAINAAVAAGLYADVFEAERAMAPGTLAVYTPDPSRAEFYARRYSKYLALADFCESL